jgi:ribosomal protein S18 acetylase RimI-like enzyme
LVWIRACREDDVDALYQVCLETGDAGGDATSLHKDPLLLGHVFVGPYAILEPSLAFVAEDDEGVAGYVVGALDSHAFEARLEREWWPKLRERYPDAPADGTPDERLMSYFHHPASTPAEVAKDYPSHLHINLLPRLQGAGAGGRLMNTLWDALREQGSPGVHLQVWARNTRAIGFYKHLGYTEVSSGDGGFILGRLL